MNYLHECCMCEQIFDALDDEIIRDDDGEWYCIPCWRVMDAKRDAEYERTEAA